MKIKFIKSVVIQNKYHMNKGQIFTAIESGDEMKINYTNNIILNAPMSALGTVFIKYTPLPDWYYMSMYDEWDGNCTIYPSDGSNDDIDDFGCF